MAESKDLETCSLQRTDGDFWFSASPDSFKNLVSKPIDGVLFLSCYSIKKLYKQRERALMHREGSDEIEKIKKSAVDSFTSVRNYRRFGHGPNLCGPFCV